MGTINQTNTAWVYKRKFSGDKPGDMAMRDHPLVKMISKKGGFTGSDHTYAIKSGNPQGISADFSTAQSGISGPVGLQLRMFRKKKYGILRHDGEAMMACADEGAFLKLITDDTTSIIEEHGDTLSFEGYRDGTGVRGEVASVSGDVATLVVADNARNFKVGMLVGAATDNTYGTVRSGTTAVVSVDEDAGTVGLDVSDITSLAAGDVLFRAGEAAGKCVEGLAAHLPLVSPVSGEDFRGVDRSVDARRYAGVRVNDTGETIEYNAGLVAVKISQIGKKADVLCLNPLNFYEVSRRMDAKIDYNGGGVKATIGFEGFDICTAAGTLRAVSDPDCPFDRGYALNLAALEWKTLGSWVHIINDGKTGGPQLMVGDEDSVEGRTRSMGNIKMTLPGSCGVFAI